MGVSKNRGKKTKWMVKIIENPIKIDDLGVPPLFLETPKEIHFAKEKSKGPGPQERQESTISLKVATDFKSAMPSWNFGHS